MIGASGPVAHCRVREARVPLQRVSACGLDAAGAQRQRELDVLRVLNKVGPATTRDERAANACGNPSSSGDRLVHKRELA